MDRHSFLRGLHRHVKPRNYFEIGVSTGRSLALSRVPSVAVDPAYDLKNRLHCDAQLVRDTSDAFFATPDPFGHLRGGASMLGNLLRRRPRREVAPTAVRLDLAFIDGMHLFEFALRDFMNTERYMEWWGVVVLDDMLPRNPDEAARDRHTKAWAGDVFKVAEVLARHRPDLVVLPVDTAPTGVLMVLGADRTSEVLQREYDRIVADHVRPDPQLVPTDILQRVGALDPVALLASPLWRDLVRARGRGEPRAAGLAMVQRHVSAVGRARPPSRQGAPADGAQAGHEA